MASDATWPTEFADFKRLDAVLKCGICYDYMTNSMITSCSHTYCSLCIRKFMQYKNQCPACFEETYEVHLRNNRPLDDIIAIFVKMKDKLQRALRLATIPIPIKGEPKCDAKEENALFPKTPKNRSSFEPKTPSSVRSSVGEVAVQLFKEKTEEAPTGSPIPGSSYKDKTPKTPSQSDKSGDDVVLNGVKIPGIFNAPISFPRVRKPDEMAQCPVCEVEVPARNINLHLDTCLAAESGCRPKNRKAVPKREPLPKRLFSLLKDPALKKILKDYGLNTQGDRKTLISRIQRYTVIYNSENDSPNPRPIPELVAQLEREEREEKKPNALLKSLARNQPQRVVIDRKADPEVIEQAHKAYREENKDSFKKLIEQMRAREGKYIKPSKPPPRVYSDDEDDPNRSVAFNPDVPSTSREDHSSDGHSLYSQATQQGYESESDIFQGDNGVKDPKRGLIDWGKTSIAEKETLLVSDSEDEREEPAAPKDAILLSSDETNIRSSVQEQEQPALNNQEKEIHVTPIKTPSRALHILLSPTESEKLADGDDSNDVEDPSRTGSVVNTVNSNDSSKKENISKESAKQQQRTSTTPADESEKNEGSDDSIDALFDKTSADQEVTPRVTRSRRKSVPRSESSTPNSTSSRGTKRKSKSSPKTANNLEEKFEFLFEKFNGDRVDDTVESDEDDTSSNPAHPEDSSGVNPLPEGRQTRRSLRTSGNMTPIPETSESSRITTRKRPKRDLSPAF
uniref:RING-type E3 ubiquitin transferase n=1 Tax=Lygus hesperus TaxID=30085 RepID=A0A0A9X1Y2_LYGHE